MMTNPIDEIALITARDFKHIHGVRCSTCRNDAPTFDGICLRCFRAWKDANLEKFLEASVWLVRNAKVRSVARAEMRRAR
jgi:predicted amidophosphoribosyltransferase